MLGTAYPANVAYPPLTAGDTGSAVEDLQLILADAGFASSDAAGVMGAGTVSALKRFQASRNLPTTGIADRGTWAFLLQDSPTVDMPGQEPPIYITPSTGGGGWGWLLAAGAALAALR